MRDVSRPAAVLFDRDGTLVVNVPYNGDPGRVQLREGAREAVQRLRAAGVPLAVISNQSGIGRGFITHEQMLSVNRRIVELLGLEFAAWVVCPHAPHEGCACRKPAPGLVLEAAQQLGVDARHCVVIGDMGSDVAAARAAGARGILVPTHETPVDAVDSAEEVALDLAAAVRLVLDESGE